MRMGRRAVADVKSIPAPVGGWNARDAISAMPETDAVQMENMFPNTTDVMLRKGSENHVTGITGTIETLAAYSSSTASQLFGSTDAAIYNVSSAGPVGAAVVSAGITSGRWQHINFGVPGGAQWLYMVNGIDKPLAYDGTTWTAVDDLSTPAITGVTTTSLIHINVFKRRIWFVERNSTKAWYLATDSIGGAATSFDVGPLFTNGGYLMAMATWSLDAGEGLDDHAVFVSSKGQVAVYQGTDPASASTFALVGVFNIGSPVGRRCFMKFGGDLLIVTRDGVMPMSKALLSDRISKRIAITDQILYAMADAVESYGSNFGWQIQQYPNGNMILLNVPVSTTEFHQYVMNTISGKWCKFTGWEASCWELFNDEIYFGTASTVKKGWAGYNDSGNSITGSVIPAFSYFGSRAQLKRWTMARPIISATGTPGILMGMNVDFDTSDPTGVPTLAASGGAVWDTDLWDTGIWGGSLSIQKDWQSVSGIGFAGSLHLQLSSRDSNVRWQATDFVFEKGATI
ncbi:hypothetical protein SAMN05216316_1061 [Nitrosovibrio sp. Nv6]|nr:hypothetical protein SAMN05216316_1061 [Nitrosovibrio sp. Nv6]